MTKELKKNLPRCRLFIAKASNSFMRIPVKEDTLFKTLNSGNCIHYVRLKISKTIPGSAAHTRLGQRREGKALLFGDTTPREQKTTHYVSSEIKLTFSDYYLAKTSASSERLRLKKTPWLGHHEYWFSGGSHPRCVLSASGLYRSISLRMLHI